MRLLAVLSFCVFSPLAANAAFINFDDGVFGAAVNAAYGAQGVTFSNAKYVSTFGIAGTSGQLGIAPISDNDGDSSDYIYSSLDRMIAVFSIAQGSVSFNAADIGNAGIRVDAYDSAVGGALVNFTEAFGIGLGEGGFQTINVAGAGILRVEIYQPNYNGADGVIVDNFDFSAATAVPEPGSLLLLGSALAAAGLFRLRRN